MLKKQSSKKKIIKNKNKKNKKNKKKKNKIKKDLKNNSQLTKVLMKNHEVNRLTRKIVRKFIKKENDLE